MRSKAKHIIFGFLLVLLALPLFQHATKLFGVRKLDGDFVLAQRPAFSWASWMDGSFQARFDRYIEDHIGFRNFFVRLNNQIDFSLFDEANAEGVVVGKNNMLYEYDYIRAYTGGDYIGEEIIGKKMRRLKFLQRYLKNKFNIDFILIFEPSKARIFPENIPDRFLQDGFSTTNYDRFKQTADDLGVRYIDLNAYFKQMKDTARFPLYPRYGIHWSEGTMPVVADTLIRYIESLRNIRMPEYRVSEVRIGDSISNSDYDIGNTINLLWRLPHRQMAYPVFTFPDDNRGTKPMVLTVADSYYWNFFNTRIPKHLFANEAFWYFNAKVYPDFYFGEKWTRNLDLKQEVEKQNVIILSVTDRFLYKFDWGFVDQVYDLYGLKYSGDLVYETGNGIRQTSGWFDRIVKKAHQNNIPLGEALHQEAKYQALTDHPDRYFTWYGMEYYTHMIDQDRKWSAAIREKAGKNNITYSEQLRQDAEWIFKKDHPEVYKKYMLIKKYENDISNDPAWMETIAKKAAYYEMPVGEMVQVDAEYMANRELAAAKDGRDEKIEAMVRSIKNDPKWLEAVSRKAEARNIPLEKMIRMDAEYMVEQQNKNQQR